MTNWHVTILATFHECGTRKHQKQFLILSPCGMHTVRERERERERDRQTDRQTDRHKRGGRNRGGGWRKRERESIRGGGRVRVEGGKEAKKTYLSVVRFHRPCKYVGMIDPCRHGMQTVVKLLLFYVDSVHVDYSCPENRHRSQKTSHV